MGDSYCSGPCRDVPIFFGGIHDRLDGTGHSSLATTLLTQFGRGEPGPATATHEIAERANTIQARS